MRKPEKPKLIVFSQEQRELVLSPNAPNPFVRRGDPTRLKIRKEQHDQGGNYATGLGAYSKPGKTARDKAKPKTGKKTNDPTICQKMKGSKSGK